LADEVIGAIRGRRRGGCPAPGPDGLSLTIWKSVPRCVVKCLAELFSMCLREGRIPRSWKRSILVLIPKGQIDAANPKARPTCLLDDVGKLFERILHVRLKGLPLVVARKNRPVLKIFFMKTTKLFYKNNISS